MVFLLDGAFLEHSWRGAVITLMVREGLSKKVTCELRTARVEGARHMQTVKTASAKAPRQSACIMFEGYKEGSCLETSEGQGEVIPSVLWVEASWCGLDSLEFSKTGCTHVSHLCSPVV